MIRKFNFLLFIFFTLSAFSQTHNGHGQVPKKHSKTGDEARVPIEVPLDQQIKIGLVVAKVEKKKVEHTIRTVGTVMADQTKEAHVHLKINGWIERIFADYVGKPIKKGQPLFELYSPDLVSTQEEYLAARRQGSLGLEIAETALERLKLWEVPKSEIGRLKKTGKSKRLVTFNSPVDGFIINKTAIQGMYINPALELYHIADLSRIWIIVTLYEYDVAVISLGDEAEISLPYDPDKTFKGKISYIYPEIEMVTRAAKARIEIDNPEQVLKPGMFSNVTVKKDLGESIVVPDDAVIDTGLRKLVFVKVGSSRFEPREVKVGPRVEDKFVINSGLNVGEEVVTSSHFFIDSESKLNATIEKGKSGHGGHR